MQQSKIFGIGEMIFVSSCEWMSKRVQCPDCFGQKFLTVTLGDGSTVTVDCPGCESGYLGSQGTIGTYGYNPAVEVKQVTGVELRGGSLHYSFDCRGANASDVFAAREDAEQRALVLSQETAAAEAQRLASKEEPNRSWAWNATYHKSCIRKAEQEIIYHRAKLDVATKHKTAEKAEAAAPVETIL